MRPALLLIFLTAFPLVTLSQEDTEDDADYSSEDVEHRVSKLRLQGAEYLQKVITQLQNDRTHTSTVEVPNMQTAVYTHRIFDVEGQHENYVTPVYNISGPTPVPDIDAQIVHKAPPPISLSKEELLALYNAAIGKVSALQTPPEDQQQNSVAGVKPEMQGQMSGPASGYYYYYFPITSFLKPTPKPPGGNTATTAAPQQLHATITMMDSPNKSVEPLFMAISGFIGMALMFFFSVLFVPKFGKIRSKNAQFKDTPDEVANVAQILLEVMAGRDCGERLACEVVRIFRGIKSNNKPLRVLEIILPPKLSQQVSLIRKVAGKKAKCEYIPCKAKKLKPPLGKPQKPKIIPWKKKPTPHDLWMKHFEKGKRETKQQQQQKQQPQQQHKQQQRQQQQQKQQQRQQQQKQQQKKNGGNRKPPAKKT